MAKDIHEILGNAGVQTLNIDSIRGDMTKGQGRHEDGEVYRFYSADDPGAFVSFEFKDVNDVDDYGDPVSAVGLSVYGYDGYTESEYYTTEYVSDTGQFYGLDKGLGEFLDRCFESREAVSQDDWDEKIRPEIERPEDAGSIEEGQDGGFMAEDANPDLPFDADEEEVEAGSYGNTVEITEILDPDTGEFKGTLEGPPEVIEMLKAAGAPMSGEEIKKDLEETTKVVLKDPMDNRENTDSILHRLESNLYSGAFSKELSSGIIPFELREGFQSKDGAATLTKEDVAEIRKTIPQFGRFLNMDTTGFYMDGKDKNMSIIRCGYDDIKKMLGDTDSTDYSRLFKEDNVEPNSIRVYKQLGDGMKVDGTLFRVANLTTFELKLKGDPLPYRTTLVVDDSGNPLAHCDGSRPIPFQNLNLGDDRIGFLDRTDVSNPGHIRAFDGKDAGFREEFLAKVEGQMPDFLEKFNSQEPIINLLGQEGYLVGLEKYFEDKLSYESDILGRFEFEREMDGTELLSSEQKLREDVSELKGAFQERSDTLTGSEYYRSLSDADKRDFTHLTDEEKVSHLTEEETEHYEACQQKIDATMEKYVDDYKEYASIKTRLQTEETANNIHEFKENVFDKTRDTLESIRKELIDCRGYEDHDEYGSYLTDIYRGVVDGERIDTDPKAHFAAIVSLQSERTSLALTLPSEYKANDEELKEVGEKLQDAVDKYNKGVPEEMKVHIGEDGRVYSRYGFAIEPDHVPGRYATEKFPSAEDASKLYKTGEDIDTKEHPENYSPSGDGPVTIGGGKIDPTSLKEYYSGKMRSLDFPRSEASAAFVKAAIQKDFSDERIKSLGVHGEERNVYYEEIRVGNLPARVEVQLSKVMDRVDNLISSGEKLPESGQLLNDVEKEAAKEVESYGRADVSDEPENVDEGSEEIVILDTSKQSPDVDGKTDKRGGNIDTMIRRGNVGPHARIDEERDVAVSKEMRDQIKQEADAEVSRIPGLSEDEAQAMKEKLIEEKTDKLKAELSEIRQDILHYEEKMNKYSDGVPTRMLSRYVPYQTAKAEFDSAVYRYEKIGGAVGNGEFVTKGVNGLERLLDRQEVVNSNIWESALINSYLGRGYMVNDVYQKEDRNESGESRNYCGITNVIRLYGDAVNVTVARATTVLARAIAKHIYGIDLGKKHEDAPDKDDNRIDKAVQGKESGDEVELKEPNDNDRVSAEPEQSSEKPEQDKTDKSSDAATKDESKEEPENVDRQEEENAENIVTNKEEHDEDDVEKSEEDADKEDVEQSEEDADKEDVEQSEEDADKEDVEQSEENADKEDVEQSEEGADKEDVEQSEEDAAKEDVEQSEEDAVKEDVEQSEEGADKEDVEQSEEDADKEEQDKETLIDAEEFERESQDSNVDGDQEGIERFNDEPAQMEEMNAEGETEPVSKEQEETGHEDSAERNKELEENQVDAAVVASDEKQPDEEQIDQKQEEQVETAANGDTTVNDGKDTEKDISEPAESATPNPTDTGFSLEDMSQEVGAAQEVSGDDNLNEETEITDNLNVSYLPEMEQEELESSSLEDGVLNLIADLAYELDGLYDNSSFIDSFSQRMEDAGLSNADMEKIWDRIGDDYNDDFLAREQPEYGVYDYGDGQSAFVYDQEILDPVTGDDASYDGDLAFDIESDAYDWVDGQTFEADPDLVTIPDGPMVDEDDPMETVWTPDTDTGISNDGSFDPPIQSDIENETVQPVEMPQDGSLTYDPESSGIDIGSILGGLL